MLLPPKKLKSFKLSNATGGFSAKKALHFIEGGDSGDRELKINNLIRQMN